MATLDKQFNRPPKRSQDMLVVLDDISSTTDHPSAGTRGIPPPSRETQDTLFIYALISTKIALWLHERAAWKRTVV
jgi:hypothetical protein